MPILLEVLPGAWVGLMELLLDIASWSALIAAVLLLVEIAIWLRAKN